MKFVKIFFLILVSFFLKTALNAQVSVYGAVDHLIPNGIDTQGGIKLSVSGSTSPYTYTWNPGAINTKDINNINAGQYTVNIKSASNQTNTAIYNVGYKVAWTNFDRCFLRNDSLISQAVNTNIYGMAASKNTLAANTDGWFEFVVPDVTSTARYFIGFVDSLMPLSSYGEIDYGIFYNSNKSLYYYEGGSAYAIIKATPKVGDVIKVERIGNTINYKINNSVVRTLTVSGIGSKILKLKASFNSSPARLINVGCSFTNLNNQNFIGYVDPKVIIRHVSSVGSSDGYSKATPRISFTNTYTWQPSGVNTQTVGSLSAGTITLTVADSLLNKSTYKYNVGYRVDWTNLDRCIYRNDSLITKGANANVYGTANSKNTLEAGLDGWFEYTIHNLAGNSYYFGFVDKLASITNSAEGIVAGFRLNSSILYYVEAGSNTALFYYAKEGDRLRIERSGNSFIYKINGVTIRTITNASFSSKALKLNILLLNTNYMANVGCSFYNKSNSTFDNYVLINPIIKHNSSSSSSDGSIKPNPEVPFANTYTWQPIGATTNSISSLPVGVYTITVRDSLNNKSSQKLKLGYKVQWTNVSQAKFRNDSLFTTSTNSNVIGSAVSKNTLSSNTNGWVEYRVVRLNNYRYYFGFTDSIHPLNYTPIDIDYGFYYTGNILYSYENNTSTVETYHLKIGDLLSVQRSNDTIYYKVNDYILKWLYVPNVSQKILKIKSSLYHTDALIDVGCSFVKSDSTYFANYVELIPEINHAGSTTLFNGSIKVTPRIVAGNTYSWISNGSNSNTINNLSLGRYTVRTSDNSGNSSYGNYNLGYKVNWTSLFNANIGGDTLRSTVTTTSSACSKDTLKAGQNGWVEYVYSESSAKSFRFGFLDIPSGTQSAHTDIDFGIYYNGAGIFSYQENSTNTVLSYNGRKGDVFRVERRGDTILYSYNGLLVRTIVSAGLSAKSLLLKSVLYNKAKLAKLGASFSYCNFTVTSSSSQTITCTSPSAILTGSTSMASPSYTWSAGGTSPNSFTTAVSAPGIYTLTVSNPTGCMAASTVAVVGSTVAPSITIESSSPTPTLGLNAYWPFNGNADDVSGNANNGTITDATLTNDRFGNPNKAYYFNGTTSRIDVPNSSTVDMPNGQDYSISFWMKAKPGNVDATPIAKNQYGAWSGYMFFANSTNGGYCNTPDHGSFYVAAGGGGDVCSNNAIYNDTTNWYFITGQYQASTNQAFMYVNSVLQTDIGSASGATSNTKQLSFGAYNDAAGFGYFKGVLDDIRFYNRLLTQSEINSLYNETKTTTSNVVIDTTIVLQASPNISGMTYTWSPGGSSSNSYSTSISSPGVYSLSVTNPTTGCVSSATVLVVTKLSATATVTDYENDTVKGQVTLNITGGVPPYNIAWNGVKYPLPAAAYKLLKDSISGIVIDSVKFVNYIDSISQITVYNDLLPSTNYAVIYDQSNDSIILNVSVSNKINNWAAKVGAVTTSNPINKLSVGNVNYFYGSGVDIVQSGTFALGNSYAVLPNTIDLNKVNEISFIVPNNMDVAYVGLVDQNSPLSGTYYDLNQKTMFKFNGNGSFDVIFNSQSIYNGSFGAGDYFSIKANNTSGKIGYYINEALLIEADISGLNMGSTLLLSKVVLGNANASVAGLKIKLPYVIGPIQILPFNKCFLYSILYSANASANPNPVCSGSNVTLLGSLTESSFFSSPQTISLPSNSYSWLPGNLVGAGPLTALVQSSQIYTLSVSYVGCVFKKTVPVVMHNLTVDAGQDQIFSSTAIPLGGSPTANLGTTPYTSYVWLPNTGFSAGSTNSQPNPSVEPLTSTTYTLTVTDAAGCVLSDEVTIYLLSSFNNSYAVLKKQLDGGYYQVQNGKLYFKFQEEYKNRAQLNYKIYDEQRSLQSSSALLPVKIGVNQYEIDLAVVGGFVNSKFYTLEVINDKNEKFILKFKYVQ